MSSSAIISSHNYWLQGLYAVDCVLLLPSDGDQVTTEHNEGSMYCVPICLSNITLYLQEVSVGVNPLALKPLQNVL